MSPPTTVPQEIDIQMVLKAASIVREQISTALWLSAGMICAVVGIVFLAVGCRKIALVWGCLYSATLCFVHNGHAEILGPLGCAAALTGIFWPERRRGVSP